MAIKSNVVNNIKVLEISGSFDIYTASSVREWLDQKASEIPANIVIDLSDVHFIELYSTGDLDQGDETGSRTGWGYLPVWVTAARSYGA